MIANTDTIHYLPFSNKVYRFFPTLIYPEDAARYHGDNERIGVDDYKRVIDFYFRLMQNADLVLNLAPDEEPLVQSKQDEL
jgi:carboxypeptidase PM20D1